MPFVQRVVEPRDLSKTSLKDARGRNLVDDDELQAVANNTLSNALRQLASLVLAATDVFAELTVQLDDVGERSKALKSRMDAIEVAVAGYDPKKVPVPVSDICTFAARSWERQFRAKKTIETSLFTAETRPNALQALYESAAKTPPALTHLAAENESRRQNIALDSVLLCTPVLGARRRRQAGKIDAEIETRLPAAVEELRRWTSTEALGDVTVAPDCVSRLHTTLNQTQNSSWANNDSSGNSPTRDDIDAGVISGDDQPIDHKLPSPEEQLQAVALKFPAVVVAVDVTGRRFDRMSRYRRTATGMTAPGGNKAVATAGPSNAGGSTTTASVEGDLPAGTVRRRSSRPRKARGKRRNTIAGTDRQEIQQAVNGEHSSPEKIEIATTVPQIISPDRSGRSHSGDPLKSTTKRSHFSALIRQWGKSRLKLTNLRSSDAKVSEVEDVNLQETQADHDLHDIEHQHQRKYSSSSDKSSAVGVVRLRDPTTQRRNRDEPHSSSGNWSASSESGRASIGSETTTTQPRSTPTISGSSGLTPGSIGSRRRFADTSASCSEGTLTPDLASHVDDETSSAYSCDTEGYYTSFHVDSGLKTLREEDAVLPVTPLHCSNALHTTGESEYELFGRGSTSTTTSSAGTVCTTLRASGSDRSLLVGPAVPERKSSLTKLDRSGSSSSNISGTLDRCGTIKRNGVLLKKQPSMPTLELSKNQGAESPDSGHNTSSSPIESAASPNGCSEFSSEFSESSDVEGADRAERIRAKTAINSSRIPSMCAITPPHSDDEAEQSDNSSAKQESSKHVVMSQIPGSSKLQLINVNRETGYATVETVQTPARTSHESVRTTTLAALKKSPLWGKIRGVLPNLKKSPVATKLDMTDGGEYVTIADVRNNNEKTIKPTEPSINIATSEYISLDELPRVLTSNNKSIDNASAASSLERRRLSGQGARVTVDCEGRIVYSSNSLKRNKQHSTFEPGPCVKTTKDSPAGGKLIVRAGEPAERVHPIITPTSRTSGGNQTGAYVNVQDSESGRTIESPHSLEFKAKQKETTKSLLTSTNQINFQRKNPAYWTLQMKKHSRDTTPDNKRSQTPELVKDHNQVKSPVNPKTKNTMIDNFFSSFNEKTSRKDDNDLLYRSDYTKISPIDPRNTGTFQSSTPSRAEISDTGNSENKRSTMTNEELYAVIHKSKKKLNLKAENNSPIHNLESRTRNSWAVNDNSKGSISDLKAPTHSNQPGQRQSWACMDRLGPSPKTSRLDFKKLLLQHSAKSAPVSQVKKISAVEQLKLDREKKDKMDASNPISILDLSSSPKSFGGRRMINKQNSNTFSLVGNKEGLQRNSSKMTSPKSVWRFSHPRSDILSSPIQEVCSEEDNNAGMSNDLQKISLKPVELKTPKPTIKPGPILAYPSLCSIKETDSSPSKQSDCVDKCSGVNLKENIFLKIEENNFMKSELKNPRATSSLARNQYMQSQRAQFLSSSNNTGQLQITAQFKNGHYTGITTGGHSLLKNETPKSPSPTLETAL